MQEPTNLNSKNRSYKIRKKIKEPHFPGSTSFPLLTLGGGNGGDFSATSPRASPTSCRRPRRRSSAALFNSATEKTRRRLRTERGGAWAAFGRVAEPRRSASTGVDGLLDLVEGLIGESIGDDSIGGETAAAVGDGGKALP